jgi:phosphoglycolate phosphatase
VSAVVFDLDGTLIDSHRDIAAAVNDVLTSLDLPPHDPDQVKRMIGGGVATLLARALGDRTDRFDDARARFKEAYRARLVDTTRCYDGVLKMLDALAGAGIVSAVATNKPSYFTTELARHLELDTRIAAFACADEVPEKKPDPAVVRLALARAGQSSAIAYVGDMPVDWETSRRSGAPFIGVAWGFDATGLAASGCERIVDQPDALEAMIVGLERKARTSTRRDR